MLARAISLLILFLALSFPAAAQTIYGSVYIGAAGPASLYRINASTGAATLIGPIGFNRVSAMAFVGQTLYGTASNGADSVLITIDTTTGAGTLIGAFGVALNATTDMAVRADGTIFTFTDGNVYTVNKSTGAATLVGTGSFSFSGNALTFVGPSLLLANTNTVGGPAGTLQRVNQTNAALTVVAPLTYGAGFTVASGPRPAAMNYSAAKGAIYASIFQGFPATNTFLATIDPVSGQVTMIGATINNLDGLAVLDPEAIPATGDAALIVVAALLLVLGMLAIGRRPPFPEAG